MSALQCGKHRLSNPRIYACDACLLERVDLLERRLRFQSVQIAVLQGQATADDARIILKGFPK